MSAKEMPEESACCARRRSKFIFSMASYQGRNLSPLTFCRSLDWKLYYTCEFSLLRPKLGRNFSRNNNNSDSRTAVCLLFSLTDHNTHNG